MLTQLEPSLGSISEFNGLPVPKMVFADATQELSDPDLMENEIER